MLSFVLLIINIDKVPPALDWDEVTESYDIWSIDKFGVDEWGVRYPFIFKSFGDYKGGPSIYLGWLVVKIFGDSEYITRIVCVL